MDQAEEAYPQLGRVEEGECGGHMMRMIGLALALALGMLAAPLGAGAQAAERVSRIGYLSAASRSDLFEGAFRQGLRELGYVEGQTVTIEYRFAEGRVDRLPKLAAELVGLKVDLIVTAGMNAARAVREATKTTPIVMAAGGDPVAAGIVASLARPGGNVTGFSFMSPDLGGKRLELLKEAMPRVSRVAVLFNPANVGSVLERKSTEDAAGALGARLQPLEVRRVDDLEGAFRAAAKKRAQALIAFRDALVEAHRGRILDLAARGRLPTMFEQRDFVEAGGLMSYGPNLPDLFRRAATYVDKILKGAKPADLPVEQPTRFELVINLKTAKALGLTIPQSILIRADQVIQ